MSWAVIGGVNDHYQREGTGHSCLRSYMSRQLIIISKLAKYCVILLKNNLVFGCSFFKSCVYVCVHPLNSNKEFSILVLMILSYKLLHIIILFILGYFSCATHFCRNIVITAPPRTEQYN